MQMWSANPCRFRSKAECANDGRRIAQTGKQCSKFKQKIWEGERFPQRWCLESWQKIRMNLAFKFHLIFAEVFAHDPLSVLKFIAQKSNLKRDQSPYSPDLAPCDFCRFPKLKRTQIWWHYGHPARHDKDPDQHSRKQIPGRFPAAAPSSRKVHHSR